MEREEIIYKFQLPCSQDLCKYTEYFHPHSVHAPLQCEEPFPSTFSQANAIEQVQQPYEVIPKEYPARVGVDSTNLPAI